MKVHRAPQTERRAGIAAALPWIARLKTRLSRVNLPPLDAGDDAIDESDAGSAELWLALLASDPEGTWHAWPGLARRTQHDGTSDRQSRAGPD